MTAKKKQAKKLSPAGEIRALAAADTAKKLVANREELLTLRLKKAAGQVENTARFRALRRENARILTVAAQKAVVAKA
jgi:large subunit ribosomal protein L29